MRPAPPPPEPVRFLCDAMLHRLARWLRAAGYDTTLAANGAADGEILSAALAEERLLLTRDRGMTGRRGAERAVVLIEGDDVAAQAASLSRRVPLDWRLAPMTRCLVCNTPLRPASGAEAAGAPPSVRERGWPVRICENCRRLFWEGSHEARIQRTLALWAEQFADAFARR